MYDVKYPVEGGREFKVDENFIESLQNTSIVENGNRSVLGRCRYLLLLFII